MSSSRDFVESYVKKKDADTASYLAEQQPSYDAKADTPLPPQQEDQQQHQQQQPPQEDTASSSSSFFSFHRATTNPIPSSSSSPIPEPTQKEQNAPSKPVYAVRSLADQRQEIHDTALANCADLNVELLNCFQHGSWWDKAKMCEDQKQRFWACFHQQKKFLKDANYKNPISTPEEDDHTLMKALQSRKDEPQQQESATAQ
ncbi:hypothetical protein BC940DRAFT_171357 [Gongronella butleri]|nr:hypothetical protein BC940DRAFT_171357 [Gongronella butleri]